jgi:hypothetical protein
MAWEFLLTQGASGVAFLLQLALLRNQIRRLGIHVSSSGGRNGQDRLSSRSGLERVSLCDNRSVLPEGQR